MPKEEKEEEIMKVFVAGGTGRVAHYVIRDLLAQGDMVAAGCRHPEKLEHQEGRVPVQMDLHADVRDLAALIRGYDAVYFLAGSRGKDLLQTDAFGAVKLMLAAQQAGVSRFVMLSSMFALQPEKWKQEPGIDTIIDYDIAKFFADHWLSHNTKLDWTIIQAGLLQETPGTGKIELDPAHEGGISIEDIAAVLADVLTLRNTYGKIIMAKNGDTPIKEALAAI